MRSQGEGAFCVWAGGRGSERVLEEKRYGRARWPNECGVVAVGACLDAFAL
jgi:hypothetical protein